MPYSLTIIKIKSIKSTVLITLNVFSATWSTLGQNSILVVNSKFQISFGVKYGAVVIIYNSFKEHKQGRFNDCYLKYKRVTIFLIIYRKHFSCFFILLANVINILK